MTVSFSNVSSITILSKILGQLCDQNSNAKLEDNRMPYDDRLRCKTSVQCECVILVKELRRVFTNSCM